MFVVGKNGNQKRVSQDLRSGLVTSPPPQAKKLVLSVVEGTLVQATAYVLSLLLQGVGGHLHTMSFSPAAEQGSAQRTASPSLLKAKRLADQTTTYAMSIIV